MPEQNHPDTMHTPGPWGVSNLGWGERLIHQTHGDRLHIAVIHRRSVSSQKPTGESLPADDNARLMAAAPELLAACREAVVRLEGLSEADYQRLRADDLVSQLNDAITKALLPAEGETDA